MRAAAAVLAALTLLTVAACSGSSGDDRDRGDTSSGEQSQVEVDTPELRKLRKSAGIEACPRTGADSEPAADGLPAVELYCLGGGREVRLPGLRGKPMVVNLWASWCEPCREELPYLQRLHQTTGDRLRVIGIDFQDSAPKAALRLAAETGVTYPLLADPAAAVRKELGVVGLPQTVFVDGSGRIVATERRAVDSYAELAGLVRKHLKVEP